MQRPEEDILHIGEFVKTLFASDAFNMLWDEFQQAQVAAMLTTEPHEAKKREGIYARLNGAKDFTEHMSSYAEAAQAIIKKRQQTVAAEELASDDEDID